MPITDNYTRLLLSQIFVPRDERQRREIDTKGIIDSIQRRGVLNPVIVEREGPPHRLIAGERRHAASKELGLPDIPVRFIDELSPIEAQIIELEENIKRQDLKWQEQADAVLRVHNLYIQLDATWTQDRTTSELGYLSSGTISTYLTVAREFTENPELRQCDTVREAYSKVRRTAEREQQATMDRLLYGAPIVIPIEEPAVPANGHSEVPAPPPVVVHDYRIDGNAAKNILLESFHHWAPKYTGPAFNLIHCDFPYGINVFAGPQAGGVRHHSYEDDREQHFALLETLLVNFDRLASTSCHVVFWFSMQHYNQILRMVSDLVPELTIWMHPLIWVKSDNTGIASAPQYAPRHVYETALLMSRGKRPIVKVVGDAYSAPTDNSLHIHTKPEPMLRHFFSMLVDEHTVFLDPTCGSGSSIRAAESLGARTLVGMDTDEAVVGIARNALHQFRAKRAAALSQRLVL